MSAPIYKILRPTRAFRKLDEKFLSKDAKTLMQKMFSKENVNITKNASGKVIAFLAIPTIIISSEFEIEKYAKINLFGVKVLNQRSY